LSKKKLNTHTGIKQAKKLVLSNKQIEFSEKLLDMKSARDFIIDELTVSSDDKKTRREIVYELVKAYNYSRPLAYKVYNEVMNEFSPQMNFTAYELQTYLLEEYQTAIDAEYEKIIPDTKAIVLALNGLQKLKDNWKEPPVKQEDLPIPILVSDPNILPNHKQSMQAKINTFVHQFKNKGVDISNFMQQNAVDIQEDGSIN